MKNLEVISMVAGALMGGSHPDQIHEVHVPRFVKMAIAIVDEVEKQVKAAEPAPEQTRLSPNSPNPPEGPGTQGH